MSDKDREMIAGDSTEHIFDEIRDKENVFGSSEEVEAFRRDYAKEE